MILPNGNKEVERVNILELKGKRVANGYNQSDIAKKLDMTLKTFCIYENSKICKFTTNQIKVISQLYKLTLEDVNHIFFENTLPNGNGDVYNIS